MPDVEGPDASPEVPEEYAAVYRDAYRRALEDEPELAAEIGGEEPLPVFPDADRPRPRWLVPAAVALGALVLVGAAYGWGRLVSGDDDPVDEPGTSAPAPTRTPPPRRATEQPTEPPATVVTPDADAYEGEVVPVPVGSVEAGCTAKPGVDSAGNPVRYDAANTADGDVSTAWRCDGRAVGETLTISLPSGTEVGEVGLIPGYAKTDEKSGADRYAENNRITQVRWTFSDGTSVEQRLDASPDNRDLQLLRVPETTSDSVTLEILGVRRGPRNTTAISEIAIGSAAG